MHKIFHKLQVRWKHPESRSQLLRIAPSSPPAMSVSHSRLPPQTAASVHFCYFWFQKLGFQTLPSQAPLILQPVLLLPVGRHPTVLPKLAFRQHCLQERSYSPKPWLWLGFEEWKHAISIPKQQGKYIGHRQTRKLSPPTIMVAGSHLGHTREHRRKSWCLLKLH